MSNYLLKIECVVCKKYFECENSLTCWCSKLPKLKKENLCFSGCMCKNCLLNEYKKSLIR